MQVSTLRFNSARLATDHNRFRLDQKPTLLLNNKLKLNMLQPGPLIMLKLLSSNVFSRHQWMYPMQHRRITNNSIKKRLQRDKRKLKEIRSLQLGKRIMQLRLRLKRMPMRKLKLTDKILVRFLRMIVVRFLVNSMPQMLSKRRGTSQCLCLGKRALGRRSLIIWVKPSIRALSLLSSRCP
jgi:hypothetical protein